MSSGTRLLIFRSIYKAYNEGGNDIMKGNDMDNTLLVIAIIAGSFSTIASFGLIYMLHRVEIVVEKMYGKYDEEKGKFDDKLMAIADVLKS